MDGWKREQTKDSAYGAKIGQNSGSSPSPIAFDMNSSDQSLRASAESARNT